MAARPAHIAVFSVPAHGHVNPSLGLVRELVRRGHRVTYANDPSFADVIEPTGATLVPYTTTLPIHGVAEDAWPEDPVAGQRLFLTEGQAALPQLRAAYGDDVPDVVLHDTTGFAGAVLAHEWGVPAVQLWSHLAPWDTYEEDNAEMLAAMRALPGYDAYHDEFAAWLAEHGVPGDVDDFVMRPALGLILIPRPMQPSADRVGPPFRFVGPVIDAAREDGAGWSPPADGRRVLLVSLGSAYTDQPAFYREVLRAFGDDPAWHVVVNVGKTIRPDDLGPAPANVELLPWVPQLRVLEHAAAFVSHCGMGSTQEALWFGVPVVGVPQAVDQFGNADMLVELGVARRVDREDASAEALRAAVEGLLADDDTRARLATVSAQLRAEGGPERAADAVEEQIGARKSGTSRRGSS